MPSFTSSKAYVLQGNYTEESRKHPAVAFFEAAHRHFDTRDHADYEEFYTADFGYRSTHGDRMDHDADAGYHDDHAFQTAAAKYYMDPLDDHEHFNDEIIVVEKADGGYNLVCMSQMYAHVKGTPAEGERAIKDPQGKDWDVVVPVTYHFDIVKDPGAKHGLKFADLRTYKDTHMINDLLEKRDHGHLKTFDN